MSKLTNGIVNLTLLASATFAVVYVQKSGSVVESGVAGRAKIRSTDETEKGLRRLRGASPLLQPAPKPRGQRNHPSLPVSGQRMGSTDPYVQPVNWVRSSDPDPFKWDWFLVQNMNGVKVAWSLQATLSGLVMPEFVPIQANREFTIIAFNEHKKLNAKLQLSGPDQNAVAQDTSKFTFSSTGLASDADRHFATLMLQKDSGAWEASRRFAFRIIRPSVPGLAIDSMTHSRHRDPTDPDGVPIYIAKSGGYLKLRGQSISSGSELGFSLFAEQDELKKGGIATNSDFKDTLFYIGQTNLRREDSNREQNFFTASAIIPPSIITSYADKSLRILATEDNGRSAVLARDLKTAIAKLPTGVVTISGVTVNGSDASTSRQATAQALTQVAATVEAMTVSPESHVDFVLRERGTGITSSPIGIAHGQQDQVEIERPDGEPLILGTQTVREHELEVVAMLGDHQLTRSELLTVGLLDTPLKVIDFDSGNVGIVAGANTITVSFPRYQKLKIGDPTKSRGDIRSQIDSTGSGENNQADALKPDVMLIRAKGGSNPITLTSAIYDRDRNMMELEYKAEEFLAGEYEFSITGLSDIYGNSIEGEDGATTFRRVVGANPDGSSANALPGQVLPGIQGSTGPYVTFQEWTPPREVPDGFNPNDKVETRVARLYFFRDAHRVAQIVNRKVRSYNRQGVSVARQLADQSRTKADQITAARQQAEREAIRKAQETRELERELSDARQSLDGTLKEIQRQSRSLQQAEAGSEQENAINRSIASMDLAAQRFAEQVEELEGKVDAAQQDELDARERAQEAESEEQLARQEQFRREVAAAHTDPDTYAPGVPGSGDPIEQTSISVIGEGLIHLRGPLKGVNQIRMMINQIDMPVGQVRVNVHSTQINGDEAEKLEMVSSRIQTYIDQARFMSVQTGEMLRKSVVAVAAHRAEEARALHPGFSQQERDQRYLYAFFGKDFVDELRAIDSEFLHTGNKLISLHSMDVTSLSSALLLMSLANNSTREMILNEFDRQLQQELPIAEARYLDAGMHQEDCNCGVGDCDCQRDGALAGKLRRFWQKHHGPPPVYSLAQNAAFQSLHGFYDASLLHDQTMTPLQREFVRLAQIFKSRLVTELEYKQRVMERALIEDRLGNRQQELKNAQRLEDAANRQLVEAQRQKNAALESVVTQLTQTQAEIRRSANEANESLKYFTNNFEEFIKDIRKPEQRTAIRQFRRSQSRVLPQTVQYYGTAIDKVEFRIVKHRGDDGRPLVALEVIDPARNDELKREVQEMMRLSVEIARTLGRFKFPGTEGVQTVIGQLEKLSEEVIVMRPRSSLNAMLNYDALEQIAEQLLEIRRLADITFERQRELAEQRRELLDQLRQPAIRYQAYYELWVRYRNEILTVFETHPEKDQIFQFLDNVDQQFDNLLRIDVSTEFRTREASEARRPLDHKKFLDMLIDDLEEKYIELLEGTRAHTANIDNYLKRLTTALDDDFNTQFYNPTFRNVRVASQWKDVEFGQTETTNVLANNREFAKVSPSATMEFDLPKRDILIKEGLDAALAIYNDVGALVNDPNLMALAAGQSGNSASDIGAGTGGGFGAVRSVLPTLSGDTQEGLLSQNAGVRPRFESNVEKLIPDPAIYKFETGTGFEIRPVIEPDGQAVVFDFNYMYTTNVREPVRADEKHLGRVKRHFIDTDVQLANFELREVSRYTVALKAERTAEGVPLLEDIPLVGVLWRPLPNREKSLQQNIIMAQATIFPTLFDLMGLRWAPAVADIDPLGLSDREFIVRGRHRFLENRVYDVSSSRVDEFLRVPEAERRADLYRSQSTISSVHPNGYRGEGLDIQNSDLREGYQTDRAYPQQKYIPNRSSEGSMFQQDPSLQTEMLPRSSYPMDSMIDDESEGPDLNNQQLPAPVTIDEPALIYPADPLAVPMLEFNR